VTSCGPVARRRAAAITLALRGGLAMKEGYEGILIGACMLVVALGFIAISKFLF